MSRSHLALGWSQALWIESVWRRSSTRRLWFVFSLVVFRSYVKIDSVDMLKDTHTQKCTFLNV